MSVAVFYVLATLLIAAALVAVAAPSTRTAMIGVLATDVLTGIMLVAAGAQLLGLVMVVAPSACLVGVGAALRRSGHGALLQDVGPFTERWSFAAAVSAGLGVLLVWAAAAGAPDDAAGGGAALLTLLHYRSPISLVMALVVAAVALGGALLIGRPGADERRLDQAAAQRRLREQRSLSRRQHRLAARTGRGPVTPP